MASDYVGKDTSLIIGAGSPVTHVLDVPVGTEAGGLLVVSTLPTSDTPAGFTAVVTTSPVLDTLFVRLTDGTEGATYSFTSENNASVGSRCTAAIFSFTSVPSTALFRGDLNSGAETTVTFEEIDSGIIAPIYAFTAFNLDETDPIYTPPSGVTVVDSYDDFGVDIPISHIVAVGSLAEGGEVPETVHSFNAGTDANSMNAYAAVGNVDPNLEPYSALRSSATALPYMLDTNWLRGL